MRQFERQRTFRHRETGATSINMVDVLTDKLTVDKGYRLPKRDPGSYRTLFKEVEIVPAMDVLNEEERELVRLEAPPSHWVVIPQTDQAIWARRLVEFILCNWAPHRFHLVLHSSGYDSRVLGAAIEQARWRVGDHWLGKILFASYGEGEGFRKLMEIEGWDDHQWMSLDDVGPLFEQGLDFKRIAGGLNGPLLGPMNLHWEFISWLQDEGRIPKDDDRVQVWCGFSERLRGACHPKGNRLGIYHKLVYDTVLSISRNKCETVCPFESYDFLRAVIESSYRLSYDPPNGSERFMRKMAEHRSPELAAVKRHERSYPKLTAERYHLMVKDYRESWYGREIHPMAVAGATRNAVAFNPWWAHYTAAAFCEDLIQKGYELSAS